MMTTRGRNKMWKCVKCKTNNAYPLGFNSADEYEYKCHDCGEIFINLEFVEV